MKSLIDKLHAERILGREELATLLRSPDRGTMAHAATLARQVARAHFGNSIYIRGLVEFTSHCRNDCLYCGIRRGNASAERYRLSREQILDCCDAGRELGFRTFVLQGGEDPYYDDDTLAGIVAAIKTAHPDCAVTLSAGERSRESYQRLFDAGADRYLLRHETADAEHYARLHPAALTLERRLRCLGDLRDIGYQTGCGFMVGSPFQTPENLADDLLFIHKFRPQMVGIGPFIPHRDTPFAARPPGGVDMTLLLLSLTRLLVPPVLLPATTALGTLDPMGRERGIEAGANVLMPNLSPPEVRGKYLLYDNKIHGGEEAAANLARLRDRVAAIGYRIVEDRGDYSEATREADAAVAEN